MEDRAGPPAAPSCPINTPRGGSKPKAPPVPKLDPGQIQHLTSWASKNLQSPGKK
jgi:hypothetical protein